MNCPYCGHLPREHSVVWTNVPDVSLCNGNHRSNVCQCELTEAEAILAAQRHAAAERLLEIRVKLNFAWKRMLSGESATEWNEIRAKRNTYQLALRDTGIQRKTHK